MEDEEGEDPKILSVPFNDPRFDGVNDLDGVHPHQLREIHEFFEVYKRLEPKKWTKFKAWKNAEDAREIVNRAMRLYEERKPQILKESSPAEIPQFPDPALERCSVQ